MRSTVLTPRDMTVLTILAEMYGAPLDVVAAMLGVSMNRAYRLVQRWQEAGQIADLRVRPVPGPRWVFPTRLACDTLLSRPVRYWQPTPKMAAHVRASLEVRLALIGLDLERWVPERILRAELGPTRPGETRTHVHDGRYVKANGELWAVEVELTAKSIAAAKAAMHSAHVAAMRAECAGLIYYVRGEATKSVVRAAYEQLPLDKAVPVTMRDVDDLITPKKTTADRPGLRVVGGAHEGRAS